MVGFLIVPYKTCSIWSKLLYIYTTAYRTSVSTSTETVLLQTYWCKIQKGMTWASNVLGYLDIVCCILLNLSNDTPIRHIIYNAKKTFIKFVLWVFAVWGGGAFFRFLLLLFGQLQCRGVKGATRAPCRRRRSSHQFVSLFQQAVVVRRDH